jgi:phosphatidate phosphatase APP1
MGAWKPLHVEYREVRNPYKKLKLFIKRRMGWLGTPTILPYIGFGNDEMVFVRGRVVENRELSDPSESDSIWSNIKAMASRYITDEIPFTKVRAEFNGQVLETVCNQYGEFEFTFVNLQPIPRHETWQKVNFSLPGKDYSVSSGISVAGDVMICRSRSKFGIISDIDDTILISHSTSIIKKMRLMLFKNASTRLPFEGVAAFYRALHLGSDKESLNPLFYVSSSEWNLYDLLVGFCDQRGIPRGTFMLHDLKVGLFKLFRSGRGKHDHKIIKIRHILTTFSNLKFILIGDSGQKDPEIYSQVIKEFPGRILAVYIRDVTNKSRDIEVKKIASDIYINCNVQVLLVKDTEAAALHAIDNGFIVPETLIDIARERYRDQYQSRTFVELLRERI